MFTPTPDLYDVIKTDKYYSLAISDAIVKSKKSCWDFICDQYSNVLKKLGRPMDCAITHHINLIDKSS